MRESRTIRKVVAVMGSARRVGRRALRMACGPRKCVNVKRKRHIVNRCGALRLGEEEFEA